MKKKLPKFKSSEEEALFWENHEILNYISPDEFKVIQPQKNKKFNFVPRPQREPKQLVSLRIENQLLEKAKCVAMKLEVGYQSILHQWIEKGAR